MANVVALVAFFIVLSFGLVVSLCLGMALWLALSRLRAHHVWRAPGLIMHELICPMGELQDPQYADRRQAADRTVVEAHDTAVAVVGLGIKPFANRAPLTVQRSERSLRHG